MNITWRGEALQLRPERGVYLPERGALLVADVHVGKAEAFQRRGVPVPSGVGDADRQVDLDEAVVRRPQLDRAADLDQRRLRVGHGHDDVVAGRATESVLDLEARNQQSAMRSHDAREGIRAFREKRKPEFRGR